MAQQQDVQEFMRVLFDAIEQSYEQNGQYGAISEIYQGKITSYVKCLKCQRESRTPSNFYDINLSVRNEFENIYNDSIEKAIFNYLQPESLGEGN